MALAAIGLLAANGTASGQTATAADVTATVGGSGASQGGAMTLPMITVEGQQGDGIPPAFPGGQVATGADLGILGNLDYMEAPFSITSYTDELIREKQVTELRDIAVMEPSLTVAFTRGNYNNGFSLRGFPAQLRFSGLKGVANYDIQTDAYERIEIVEGPNALLFGDFGGIGGTINLVPKRAGDEPLTRTTLRFQSDSQLGATFDVGRRYGPNGELGVRVNFSGSDGDLAVGPVNDQHLLGSIALDLRLDRVRASLDGIWQRNQSNVIGWGSPAIDGATGELPDPDDLSSLYYLSEQNLSLSQEHSARDWMLVGQVEADLTDSTLLRLAYGTFAWTYRYISADYAPLASTSTVDTYNVNYGESKTRNDAFSASVTQELNTGPVQHNLTFAYNQNESSNGWWSDIMGSYTRPAGDYEDQPQFDLSDFDSRGADYSTIKERSFGVVDRFGPLDGSWMIVGGIRRQELESPDYNAEETTATVGALARITDEISVYGNYGQGLEPGQVVPVFYNEEDGIVYQNAGDVLSPYVSESYEVGVKLERGSIGATAALFQITRPSVVNQEVNDTTYRLLADGEQRNRGVELNVFGEPIDGLRLVAGVAFLDPELTGTEGGANDGNVAPGTSKRGASLYGEWDVRRVEGLSLSSGLTYRSRQFADPENTAWIDDYTTVDVGVSYEPPRLPGALLAVEVVNVFDNKYWSTTSWGTTSYGEAPRTIKAALSMDF